MEHILTHENPQQAIKHTIPLPFPFVSLFSPKQE